MGFIRVENCGRGIWLAAICQAAAIGSASDRDFDIACEPLFLGLTSSSRTLPMLATCTNRGKNAKGFIIATGNQTTISVPIDLPKGATKSVVLYLPSTSSPIDVRLETDSGSTTSKFGGTGNFESSRNVLFVTDAPGIGTFLRVRNQTGTATPVPLLDTYCTPATLPDRASGYDAVSAIVLADGIDRVSDSAMLALKLYAASGGTLIFVGGASTPGLFHPRWSDLLPVRNPRLLNVPADSVRLTQSSAPEEQGQVSVLLGEPVSGAQRTPGPSGLLGYSKGYGAGRAIYLPFNPFEPPMRLRGDRRDFFTKGLRLADFPDRGWIQSMAYGRYFEEGSAVLGRSPASMVVGTPNDPFDLELPDTGTIFTILAVYFILVAPINLLILKKMKRGELAWVTAPVLSLGFAGIFFGYAGNLYSAGLSRSTDSAIIVQEGLPVALVYGQAQLFFPRGGSYDLRLQNVETVNATDPNQMYSMGGQTQGGVEVLDVGTIIAPAARASNLSFYQLYFCERTQSRGSVIGSVTVHKVGGARELEGWVQNQMPFPIANAHIVVGDALLRIEDLPPGKRIQIKGAGLATQRGRQTYEATVERIAQSKLGVIPDFARIAVVGTIRETGYGPQIGSVSPRSVTRILAFSQNRAEVPVR